MYILSFGDSRLHRRAGQGEETEAIQSVRGLQKMKKTGLAIVTFM